MRKFRFFCVVATVALFGVLGAVQAQSVNSSVSISESVIAGFPDHKVAISEMNLYSVFDQTPGENKVEKYGGYYAIPLNNNNVPADENLLPYSYEVHNTDLAYGAGRSVFINTLIENYENGFLALPSLQKIVTFQAKPMIVCFDEMDISQLPTGKYYLVVKVMDNNNAVLKEQRQFFTNENPTIRFSIENYDKGDGTNSFVGAYPLEVLKEYILMLAPISTQFESDFFKNNINKCSLKQLQNYFYTFWYQHNNLIPERAWKEFLMKD